jgi:two-component system NtrC family sensor kinase
MRLIVTQLLQFARPTEYAGYVTAGAAGASARWTTAWCWSATCWRAAASGCERDTGRRPPRTVAINRQELQQVLVNLLVNAIHAMPEC